MIVPIEISYRDVEKTQVIDNLIREKASKLDKYCDYITSCRVAVEKPHEHVKTGNQFRIRLDISVPPGHSVVVTKEPGNNKIHDPLAAVIRDAFKAAERQLKELSKKQREEVKTHPLQEATAFIERIFHEEGYGFIRDLDGREVYFHKNSVVNDEFNSLKAGATVHYFETLGEDGPQATTVHIVDNTGNRIVDPSDYNGQSPS